MFIILRTILTQIQKPDTLAVMDHNFCDIQTDMVKNAVGGDKHIDRYTHTHTDIATTRLGKKKHIE